MQNWIINVKLRLGLTWELKIYRYYFIKTIQNADKTNHCNCQNFCVIKLLTKIIMVK